MSTWFEAPTEADWWEIKNSRGLQDFMEGRAEAAREHAISISPYDTGEYMDSFEVEAYDEGDRAAATLTNHAEHAWAVEWGEGAFYVLSTTIDWLEAQTDNLGPRQKFSHITRDGRTIQATRKQIENWTGGGR